MIRIFLEKFIYMYSLVIVIIGPLAFDREMYRPFDLGKSSYFKMMAGVLGIIWTFWILIFKETDRLKKLKPVLGPVLLSIIIFMISTLYSTDPWTSLVGVYERQIGLLGILSAIMVFVALVTTTQTSVQAICIIYAILTTNLLASIHAILQSHQLDPFGLGQSAANFASGVMGHHNFLGNFLAFGIPLTLWIGMESKNKLGKTISAVAFLLQSYAIFLTITRGAYVGAVAGVICFICLYTYHHYKNEKNHKIVFILAMAVHFGIHLFNTSMIMVHTDSVLGWIFFVAIMIANFYAINKIVLLIEADKFKNWKAMSTALAVVALLLSTGLWRYHINLKSNGAEVVTSPYHQRYQTIARYFSIYNFINTSPRFQLWKETIAFVPKASFTGVGLETFRREFMAKKTSYLESLEPNTNYDNPHNNYLYYLATTGIIGLFSLVWLMIRFIKLGWLGYLQNKNTHLYFALISSMVSYMVWNLPGFDVLPILITFWATIAAITTLINVDQVNLPEFKEQKIIPVLFNPMTIKIFKYVMIVAIIPAAIFNIDYSWRNIESDKYLLENYKYQQRGNFNMAIKSLDRAIELNPQETFYKKTKGMFLYNVARSYQDPQGRAYFIKQAEDVLKSALEHCWAPENVYIAQLNGRLSIGDIMGAYQAADQALVYSPHLAGVINMRDRLKLQIDSIQQRQQQLLQEAGKEKK